MGFSRPEVAAALVWTGTVTTAGCAYLEATAMASLSSADAMVIFASEPCVPCRSPISVYTRTLALSLGCLATHSAPSHHCLSF